MSGKAPKIKGSNFERELVNDARAHGLCAERAYASDGRSLNESRKVDVLAQGMRLSCKRHKKFPKYLALDNGVDGVVFRQDRGPTLVLLRWTDLRDKLKEGW